MRIFIIGGSGLVGSHVLAEAARRGHETAGTYRNQVQVGLVAMDLADAAAATEIIKAFKPDWVVHAAGWTWVDGCEKDPARAMRENTDQPAMLAALCRKLGCRFAYFSTTYIFDGHAGPYAETATPNPINVYARSKWEGEQAVLAALPDALIPRVICVWGQEALRKNFVYQVIKAVSSGQPMRIPSDQLGNPSWAGDIAAWLLDLMEAGQRGPWHLAGDGANTSREGWLQAILRGLESVPALREKAALWSYQTVSTAEMGQPALRPLHAGADIALIQKFSPRIPRQPSVLTGLVENVT